MKTASLLFGLATACATVPEPQYPLCDLDGAPACGNIGQVGRSASTPAIPAASTPRNLSTTGAASEDAAPPSVVRAATAVRVVVQASSEIVDARATAVPLVNRREEVVCGNVMGKGGNRRVCRDAATQTVTSYAGNNDGTFTVVDEGY